MNNNLKIISGNSNRNLSEKIGKYLGVNLCDVTLDRFGDGEIQAQINENIRGVDAFIVQSTQPPAENLMELLVLTQTCFLASADRITCVIPYYGYARQDRKDQPRVAISAKLMANMISVAGADRVLAMDFHQHQLQGFFDLPVDHLYAAPVFTSHYRQKRLKDLVVVAADVGGAKMARGYAKRLNGTLAIIDKRRPSANIAEVVNVVGDVEGCDCLIPDDMIDTGGTMTQAIHALKRLGARDIYCCATHPLLSGPAVQRLQDSPLKELAVSNSIVVPEDRRFDRLKILSIAPLFSKAIRYTHSDQSVSSLFD